MLRSQVGHKILPGIPFFKKKESIFVLDTLAQVAAPATLLGPHGADQGLDRLGQLLALLGYNPHSYDYEDHKIYIANGLPKT